ncbi:MAG: sigma-70 family RNA polymerase sigma factor, partial [Actinomycetota bacterium]
MDQSPLEGQRFRRVYEDNVDAIRRYCYRRIPASEVDDATTEVFMVVWKRFDSVPDGENTLPWIFGVARNVIRNHDRSVRRRGRLTAKLGSLPTQTGPSAEVQVIRRIEDETMLDAVRSLKAADREILMLAAWEGLKPCEIAAALGIDPHAASMRL